MPRVSADIQALLGLCVPPIADLQAFGMREERCVYLTGGPALDRAPASGLEVVSLL
jgi:hypothetical protein